VGVWARITDDGRSLEILSRVSGVDLYIEENGGLAATALGLRSMHAGTTLAGLNGGRGVSTVPGSDLRITTASGTTIDIDLDGAETLQDVLDRLNTGGAGAITATLASQGNGLVITDQTAGAGTLTIQPLNDSPALSGLGLDVSATGNQLVGRDVNPIRVDSPFTALLELRTGLQGDDRLTMITAGERIERVMERMQQVQGQLASQARVMADRSERVETETTATRVLLSDVRDVDIADAAVRFQQLQMALQANLSTALQVMNLSLLDYLR
jgi:flagellin-like hook-associated protein FlgL